MGWVLHSSWLILGGSPHTTLDAKLKALCPVTVFVCLLAIVRWLDYRNSRKGLYSVMMSARYWGWLNVRTLKVINASLYSTRCAIGSQCSSFSTGWICSRRQRLSATTLASEFWTLWSLEMFFWLMANKLLLNRNQVFIWSVQSCSLEDHARTTVSENIL